MKQSRICFANNQKNDLYIEHMIRQDTQYNPWTVELKGWKNAGLLVTIKHWQLPNGRLRFSNCKFETNKEFASFVQKMLELYKHSFYRDRISFGANDYLALMRGYKEGVNKAGSYYIDCSNE